MSATILCDNTLAQITKALNKNVIDVLDLKYRPHSGGNIGGAAGGATTVLIPAITAEELGLRTVELNAYRRGMQDAADILRHEHQQLIAPDTPVSAEKQNGKGANAPIY